MFLSRHKRERTFDRERKRPSVTSLKDMPDTHSWLEVTGTQSFIHSHYNLIKVVSLPTAVKFTGKYA